MENVGYCYFYFFPDATQIFISPSVEVTRIKVKGDNALSAKRWYSYTPLYPVFGLFLSPRGVIYVATRFNSSSEQNSSDTFTALMEKTFRKTVEAVKGLGALVNLMARTIYKQSHISQSTPLLQ